MTETKITYWLDHPKASQVCALEYEITQGYRGSTKENWKVIDDLRDEIDKDIERGIFKISTVCDECDGSGKWKENEWDKEINCPKCNTQTGL